MEILCKYYSNKVRLETSVSAFAGRRGFRFYCLSGSMTFRKNTFKLTTETVAVIATCMMDTAPKLVSVFITNDPKYRDSDGKNVDIVTLCNTNIEFSICRMLRDKFKNTNNPFELIFSNKEYELHVSLDSEMESPEFKCRLISDDGECIVVGDRNLKGALENCRNLCGFKYTATSDGTTKTVDFEGKWHEVLREIVQYLGKTIVISGVNDNDQIVDQYVTVSGVAEVFSREDGVRIYKKIPVSKMQNLKLFSIYQTTMTREELIKTLGRDIRRENKG